MSPWPELALPPDGAQRAAAWAEAEARGDDRALLALRELEQACAGLPPIIDGARRTRLLAVDPLATTWEAWHSTTGQRLLLRCLQPRWRGDPVLWRRFGRPPPDGSDLALHLDGDWPHLRLPCPGLPLVDHLPSEDPPATAVLARLLGAGLVTLDRLHAAGRYHGGPVGPLLTDGPDGARLAWLDAMAPERRPAQDLAALGLAVAALDPEGTDPVGQLARSWATSPPPRAVDGLAVLQATLGAVLLDHRHRLALARRRVGRRDRATRLAAQARALSCPPPPGTACLHADRSGLLTLVHSDGAAVWGGDSPVPTPEALGPVWSAAQGLHPQAARRLLRAWARREEGDGVARREAQVALGSTDADAERLVRWLRAMAALRRARLLLSHQAGGPAVQSSTTVTR